MAARPAALEMRQCRPLPPLLRPGRPSLARGRRPVRLPLAPCSQQGPQEGASGATLTEAAPRAQAAATVLSRKQEGASTDLSVILPRLKKVGACGHWEGLQCSAKSWHVRSRRPACPAMACMAGRPCAPVRPSTNRCAFSCNSILCLSRCAPKLNGGWHGHARGTCDKHATQHGTSAASAILSCPGRVTLPVHPAAPAAAAGAALLDGV